MMTMTPSTVACRVCGARLWWTLDSRRWAVTRDGHAVWIDEPMTRGEDVPDTCPDHRGVRA